MTTRARLFAHDPTMLTHDMPLSTQGTPLLPHDLLLLTTEEIQCVIAYANGLIAQSWLRKRLRQGDRWHKGLTKHGIGHAREVMMRALYIADKLKKSKPDLLPDQTWGLLRAMLIIVALMHDLGLSEGTGSHIRKAHEDLGAKCARTCLLGAEPRLPIVVIQVICEAIEHLDPDDVLNNGVWSIVHAILILADKTLGLKQDRVRAPELRHLQKIAADGWQPDAVINLDCYDFLTGIVYKNIFTLEAHDVGIGDASHHLGWITNTLTMDATAWIYHGDHPREGRWWFFHLYGSRYTACMEAAHYLGLSMRIEILLLTRAHNPSEIDQVEVIVYRPHGREWEPVQSTQTQQQSPGGRIRTTFSSKRRRTNVG